MPTLMRWQGYRFYFWSNEGADFPHVHIDKKNRSAKFWLSPVAMSSNFGYSEREVNILLGKLEKNREEFLGKWHEYFEQTR